MKNHPPALLLAILLLGLTGAAKAQTTLLIQPGDTVPGIDNTNARLTWVGNVSINEFDGYAFLGSSYESSVRTNTYIYTNRTISVSYTNVLRTNLLMRFNGVVTNVVSTTNRWNVNGTTNTYVSSYPLIRYTTNGTNFNSFVRTNFIPQGMRITTNNTVFTNSYVTTVRSTNYTGIWATDTNNSLGLIVKDGDVAPGASNNFISFSSPVYNNRFAVAFVGYTKTDTNSSNGPTNSINNGIWTTQPFNGSNSLTLVAKSGSPAPGTSTNFNFFNSIMLPDTGGVIFQATAGTNQGIWAQDATGTLNQVAINGQTLQVGNTNKVIRSVSLNIGAYPGGMRTFNQDTGTIIYQAWFTDGTSAWMKVNR